MYQVVDGSGSVKGADINIIINSKRSAKYRSIGRLLTWSISAALRACCLLIPGAAFFSALE